MLGYGRCLKNVTFSFPATPFSQKDTKSTLAKKLQKLNPKLSENLHTSQGKLLWRTRFMVARVLRRSNLTVARGLRRTHFTVARASCDRHLCRKRPLEELFHGRKRLLRPALMSQEASGGVVLWSQEALTQLYCISASRKNLLRL